MLKPAMILIPIVLLSAIDYAAPASTSSEEHTVRALEQNWLQNEDNPAVLESILADDFIHVLPAGFITKQQHLDFISKHPHPGSEKRSFEELRIRIYGDTAIANGIVTASEAGNTQSQRSILTDVFVRRNGKWQAVNAQELPLPSVNSHRNERSRSPEAP